MHPLVTRRQKVERRQSKVEASLIHLSAWWLLFFYDLSLKKPKKKSAEKQHRRSSGVWGRNTDGAGPRGQEVGNFPAAA